MKRFLTPFLFSLATLVAVSLPHRSSAQVGVEVSYQTFYDELSPYGEWIDYPEYGYVWAPSVADDFRPYSTNGRWVWSDDYDWTWVSDYNWGWAPFHYGRWFHDPYYGWLWVPGYEWSPAWVAWRDGGDYYGWAPLRPGIQISVGFSLGSYNPPIDYWCFTPRRYIMSSRLYDYCAPRSQNITIINNTTIINNYSRRTNNIFVTGPRRGDAERYAGTIRSVRFRDSNRPGRNNFRNNTVNIYRPQISRNNDRSIAPRQVSRYDNSNRSASINRDQRINQGNDRVSEGRNNRNINTDRSNREVNSGNRIERNNDNNNGRSRDIQRERTERRERPAINNENRRERPDGNIENRRERPARVERPNESRTFERNNNNSREVRRPEARMPERNRAERPQTEQRQQRNMTERNGNRFERPAERQSPQRNREVRAERPSSAPRINNPGAERRVERSAPVRENREIRRGGGRGN